MSYPRLSKCMPDEARPNPFYLLNKAVRFGHCRMLLDLGVQDFGDDAGASRLMVKMVGHLDLYRAMSEAREVALLEALAAHRLGVDISHCQDHAGHLQALTELASLVRAVNVAAPQRRRPASRSIYRCYALYAASDMARMDEDETLLLATLHDRLPDETLRGIEGRAFALLTPPDVAALLHLLRPALSAQEYQQAVEVLCRNVDPGNCDKAFAAA